jgi:hypothetical protein
MGDQLPILPVEIEATLSGKGNSARQLTIELGLRAFTTLIVCRLQHAQIMPCDRLRALFSEDGDLDI